MGLYDANTGFVDPVAAGLLSAGFSGLQASGPSMMPTSLGQVIGGAGNAGLGSFMGTLRANQQYGQGQALIGLEQQKMRLTETQVNALLRQQGVMADIMQNPGKYGFPTNGPALGPGSPPAVSGGPALATGPQPALGGMAGAGLTLPGAPAPGAAFAATPSVSPQALPPAQPAPQAATASQGIPGLPQMLLGAFANSPGITEAGKAIADWNKPQPGRAGAPLWGRDAAGNVAIVGFAPKTDEGQIVGPGNAVTTAPGYLTSATEIGNVKNRLAGERAAQEASARAGYELVPGLTDNKGRPLYRSISSVLPQGQPSAATPQAVPNSALPQNAQGAITAIPASEVPQARAAGINVSQNTPGGFGQSPAERTAAVANEQQLAEEAKAGRESANLAVDSNYGLQHVLSAVQGFAPGKYTDTVMGLRAAAQGVAPDLFPKEQMDKLASFQDFNKWSIRLGFDQARKMGARESTQIVEMSIKSNPNPEMTGPALESVTHGLMAQNDYYISKEQARQDWQDKHNGTLGGFNSYWQKTSDPLVYLLARQSPGEQAQLIKSLSMTDRKKLSASISSLKTLGYVK